jgi:hypothetical protein
MAPVLSKSDGIFFEVKGGPESLAREGTRVGAEIASFADGDGRRYTPEKEILRSQACSKER